MCLLILNAITVFLSRLDQVYSKSKGNDVLVEKPDITLAVFKWVLSLLMSLVQDADLICLPVQLDQSNNHVPI